MLDGTSPLHPRRFRHTKQRDVARGSDRGWRGVRATPTVSSLCYNGCAVFRGGDSWGESAGRARERARRGGGEDVRRRCCVVMEEAGIDGSGELFSTITNGHKSRTVETARRRHMDQAECRRRNIHYVVDGHGIRSKARRPAHRRPQRLRVPHSLLRARTRLAGRARCSTDGALTGH